MEDAGDVAERARFDRVDQRAHPAAALGGERHGVGRAEAAFGRMLGGAVFGRIDDFTGEQAGDRIVIIVGVEAFDRLAGEMRLRQVEADAAKIVAELFGAGRIGGEQVGKGGQGGRGLERGRRHGTWT